MTNQFLKLSIRGRCRPLKTGRRVAHPILTIGCDEGVFDHLNWVRGFKLVCHPYTLIKNPDGSIAEGIPPGYKGTLPSANPRQLMNGVFTDVNGFEVLEDEVEYLYSSHVSLFLVLVFFQFVIDLVFNILYVSRSAYALAEIGMVYVGASTKILECAFWTVFAVEIAYCIAFYSLVLWATNCHCARKYNIFSQVCIGGVVGHVLMAYINKFNLLIFFLRLIAYMYARFLRSLCLNMQLAVRNQ